MTDFNEKTCRFKVEGLNEEIWILRIYEKAKFLNFKKKSHRKIPSFRIQSIILTRDNKYVRIIVFIIIYFNNVKRICGNRLDIINIEINNRTIV